MWKNEGTNATAGGEFTNGNPVGPVPRSILGADWLNMIQRELQNLVTGAGLALDEGNESQLLAAVIALAASRGFSTGDGKITLKTAADTGWVMANDGTLGKAGSGATTRANADTEALYTLLWNNVGNADAPVSGGRGANAAADFAAGKTIALTKQLGRSIAIAGAGAGLTARTLGATAGSETHTMTEAELVPHVHENDGSEAYYDNGSATAGVFFSTGTGSGIGAIHATASTGGGDPFNILDPKAYWNVMIKL